MSEGASATKEAAQLQCQDQMAIAADVSVKEGLHWIHAALENAQSCLHIGKQHGDTGRAVRTLVYGQVPADDAQMKLILTGNPELIGADQSSAGIAPETALEALTNVVHGEMHVLG